MKNLALAVIEVMKAVKGMEKNSRVGTGNSAYDGTKYKDVAEVFNNAMEQNGLCILPIGIEEETKIDRWTQEYNGNQQQKQSVFTKVRTKYLLLHSSGESVELAGYGHGVDPQDKGAGKATTYALKNTLLYAFLTPVGKIDDTDTTHSDDIKTPTKEIVPNQNQSNFEAREITKKEVDSKWNGKLYSGNSVYIDNVKVVITKEQVDKLKAHPKYKPDEKK